MSSKLFQPIQVGRNLLRHRVVMPPLTRNRANKEHVVGDDVVEHYAQRAAVPGTLIITEATYIARRNAGLSNWATTPGIWSSEQIAAWKKV
jgi:NADPH2 dehydrogenase